MGNCKNLDKLFSGRSVLLLENGQIALGAQSDKINYSFKGEELMFKRESSTIKKIFLYNGNDFNLIYERPIALPDIQTGDFVRDEDGDVGVIVGNKVYYENGYYDDLSIIIEDSGSIAEVRRPTEYQGGFNCYDDMPVIWYKK